MLKERKDIAQKVKEYRLGHSEVAYGLLKGPNYDLSEPLGLVSSKNDIVISLDKDSSDVTGIYYIRHGKKGNLVSYSFLGKRMNQDDFLNEIAKLHVRPELKGELDDMDTYMRNLYEMGKESEVDVIVPVDSNGAPDFKGYVDGAEPGISKIRFARKTDSVFSKFDGLISKHIDTQEMLKQYKRVGLPLHSPIAIFNVKEDDEEELLN